MIKIEKPKVKIVDDKAVLTCTVLIDNKKEEIFYEIDKKYKEFLCTERSDAFIIAAFYYAMKHHHDIVCEVPMTSCIYHNLTTYLMPTLYKHSNYLSKININVPLEDTVLDTKGEVGTGMSCGIDSFHVLNNYLNSKIPSMKLTCLTLNNVGSFKAYHEKYNGIGSATARDLIIERALKVAKEVNLPLIITDSNIHTVFKETYYRVHTFSNMFSVFLLQKFFSKYYYASSGFDLSHYNVMDNYHLDSAEYDLLTFYSLSTPNLKIYSEGAEKNRLEKTIDISNFDLAQNYLHVCIKNSDNCGKCLKCRRTLLSLEAIDKLDNFKNVFDLKYYHDHKNEYLEWLEKEKDKGSLMNINTWKLLRQKAGYSNYTDIKVFNDNAIIIPENSIETISIMNNNDYILNKGSKLKYKSDLYCKLYVCLQLAEKDNEIITIPKHIYRNTSFPLTSLKAIKRKLKYLKSFLKKDSRKIKLHKLIYLILYKPEASRKIINYLCKNGYTTKPTPKRLNNTVTTKYLVDIFNKSVNNEIMKKALTTGYLIFNKKKYKNYNAFTTCRDKYFENNQFTIAWLTANHNHYFLAAKVNGYYIAMISKYDHNIATVYNDASFAYNILKKLN